MQSKKQVDGTLTKVSNQLAKANEKLAQVTAERDYLKKELARSESDHEVSTLRAQLAQNQQRKEAKLAEQILGTEAIGSFPTMTAAMPPATFLSPFGSAFHGANVQPYGYHFVQQHQPQLVPSHSAAGHKDKKMKKRKMEGRRYSESDSSPVVKKKRRHAPRRSESDYFSSS